jgi:aspartyl protease family protein
LSSSRTGAVISASRARSTAAGSTSSSIPAQSLVTLTESDAARLGFHPAQRDYTAQLRTANGTIRGAPLRLDRVEIGGLALRDVAAVVLPDEALSENLLGLSFLSRLHRFEYHDGRLVLED